MMGVDCGAWVINAVERWPWLAVEVTSCDLGIAGWSVSGATSDVRAHDAPQRSGTMKDRNGPGG